MPNFINTGICIPKKVNDALLLIAKKQERTRNFIIRKVLEEYLYTQLFKAIYDNNVQEVQELLESGVNVNAKDYDESTPLTRAVFVGNSEMVELLFKFKADVNAKNIDGGTPLQVAVILSNTKMVEVLLKKGADPHIKNKGEDTALTLAKTSEIKNLLQQYGAKE
jgi:cytohesin